MNRISFIFILITFVTFYCLADNDVLKVHDCDYRRSRHSSPDKFVVKAKNSILAIESMAVIVSTQAYGFPITSVECESVDKEGKSSLTSLMPYTCELTYTQNPELNYKINTWAQSSKNALVTMEMVNTGSLALSKKMRRPNNIKCTKDVGEDSYSTVQLNEEAKIYHCEYKIEDPNEDLKPNKLRFRAFSLEQAITNATAGVRLKSSAADKVKFLGCEEIVSDQPQRILVPQTSSPGSGTL